MSSKAIRFPAGAKATTKTGPDHNAHFEGQAVHMLCRLRDHIERLDSGVAYAEDDIALLMRALLHHGKGNRVLDRLRRLYGLSGIEIRLSRPPSTVEDVRLTIGSLPTVSMVDDDGSAWYPVEKWASRPLIRVRDTKTIRKYTWGDFLNDYANKWGGAHLDRDVPTPLLAMEQFEAGGLSLPGYLLRAAAVQAWLAGQHILGLGARMLPGLPAEAELSPYMRVGAPGGILDDPQDVRGRGELQWLDYLGHTVDFLLYVLPDEDATLRVQPGGKLGYRVVYRAHDAEQSPQSRRRPGPAPAQRSRRFAPANLQALDFSQNRRFNMQGRILPHPSADDTSIKGSVTIIPEL